MIKWSEYAGVTKVKLSRLEMLAILAEDITSTITIEDEDFEECGVARKHDRKLLKKIRKSILTGWSDSTYVKYPDGSGGYSSLKVKSGDTGMELYVEFLPACDVFLDSEDDGMAITVFDDTNDDIIYESLWDVELLYSEGILKDAN